jgi:hypothetical protein
MMTFKRITITEEIKEQIGTWIEALRSGKYIQAKGSLQHESGGFCCLGVGCKIFILPEQLKEWGNGRILGYMANTQDHAPEWLKKIDTDFRERTGKCLVELNDGHAIHQFSFDEIADLLQLVYLEGAL